MAGFGDSGDDVVNAVSGDGSGDVVIAGGFRGTVDFGGGPLVGAGDNDVYLVKHDDSGVPSASGRTGAMQRGATAAEGPPAGPWFITGMWDDTTAASNSMHLIFDGIDYGDIPADVVDTDPRSWGARRRTSSTRTRDAPRRSSTSRSPWSTASTR